ncbi:hypothetical protein ABGB18_00690 [Nonomuraea sp. B12E4]|uniref:hypothetical protein n=1 Tax=Nonomuraea sp. B12E4 TaxID=3153564 RepID=UPI00325D75AA
MTTDAQHERACCLPFSSFGPPPITVARTRTRRTTMRARRLTAAGIAGATVVATMLGAGPSSAATSPASTDDAQLKTGYTVLCSDGTGELANFSWTPGTLYTTVYYNNHCLHDVNVTVHDDAGGATECLTTTAVTKGSKEFYGRVEKLTRDC